MVNGPRQLKEIHGRISAQRTATIEVWTRKMPLKTPSLEDKEVGQGPLRSMVRFDVV